MPLWLRWDSPLYGRFILLPTLGESNHRRKFGLGNRCGFNSLAPRINNVGHAHPLIRKMQEGCRCFFTERRDGQLFLNRKKWRNRDRFGNYQKRNPRGERAEAVTLVTQFLVGRMSLSNFKILNLKTGGGISISDIAQGAGVSVDRAKAAIFELVSCGHLGGYQPRELDDQHRTRGKVSVRWFTKAFVASIHCWRAWLRFKRMPADTPAPGPAARLVEHLARSKGAPDVEAEDHRAKIAQVMMEIRLKHPEWPESALRLAASDRFR